MPAETETIALPCGPTVVHWRRSARARRLTLRIDPRGGGVVVTLPPRAARAAGVALLRDHSEWVAIKLARLPGAVELADGAEVMLCGTPHRVRHVPGERGGAWVEAGEIRVAGEAAFVPRRVRDLLRAEAGRRLGALAAERAAAAGLQPRRVVVKDTRTRWGSCTADGTLMFCWRLVMAPAHVQHYVVAHEVAHLRHMNHGAAFWALVEQLTPHRATASQWLAAEGAGLQRVG